MNKYNIFSNIKQTDMNEDLIFNLENYDKQEIFRILPNLSDDIKPIAIITLKSIEDKNEADILISLLTGQDGRTREAVSCILKEIEPELLIQNKALNILVEAICDINPNVVRNVINLIENQTIINENIASFIIKKTRTVLEELTKYIKGHFSENLQKSTKNHAKNKLTFNLYWLLECISILNFNENIEDILQKSSTFLDYTIREKTAKILAKMENPPEELLKKLKQDENIYVKNQLL